MSSFQGSGRKSANAIAYSYVSTETAKCFNCDWLRLLPFTSTFSVTLPLIQGGGGVRVGVGTGILRLLPRKDELGIY